MAIGRKRGGGEEEEGEQDDNERKPEQLGTIGPALVLQFEHLPA